MKRKAIFLTIAAGLVAQAVALAADSNNTPSASANVRQNKLQPIYQFTQPNTSDMYRIDRYGGISSRPWTQTAGWASQTTQFAGDRENLYEPHFNLFWLGARPD